MITGSQQSNYDIEAADNEYVFSLRSILNVVWKRAWIVALVMVLFSGLAVAQSLQQTPLYEASTKILVGREGGITENPNDVIGFQQLAVTMAEAVDSRPVAEAAIRQQGLKLSPGGLLSGLSAEVIPETQFLEVTYVDSKPERARRAANAIGTAFSKRISEVSQSSITATVWEPAVTPVYPISPTPWRDGFVALVLGSMVGLGLVFLLEHLDDSWRSPEEAEQISGVPTFGIIPEFEPARGKQRAS